MKWRAALGALTIIGLCALLVMVADGEEGGTQVAEQVKVRMHSAARTAGRWLHKASRRMPTLKEISSLPRREQQQLLSELKSEKQSLKQILQTQPQHGKHLHYSNEEWHRHSGDVVAEQDLELTDAHMSVPGLQRRQDIVKAKALETTAASILADVRREELYDLKRRREVESDEDELEEEQTMAFTQKMQEKDRKSKEKIQRLQKQLRDLQLQKEKRQQNTATKVEQTQSTEAAPPPQPVVVSAADTTPAVAVQVGSPEPHAEVQPVVQEVLDSDPSVDDLTAQIATLEQELHAPAAAPTQQASPEPVMDLETTVKTEDVSLPEKKTKQARAVPAASVAVEDTESIAEKSLKSAHQAEAREMLHEAEDEVQQEQQDAARKALKLKEEPEPGSDMVDGGEEETASDAEYGIMYYALWGSLGAFVIGILGTVIYCAIQAPRDRPWGMPPKRNY